MADTINTRGEVVASGTKKVRVTLRDSVVGEDGVDLFAGGTYSVSQAFARDLLRRGRAVKADEAEEPAAEKPAGETAGESSEKPSRKK